MSIVKPHPTGRPVPGRVPQRREASPRTVTLLRRLLSAVRRRLRWYPPPPYGDARLCRDIGIEPPPREEHWPWPWYDRRA